MRWRRDKSETAELRHSVEGLAVWVRWSPKDGLRFSGQHFMRGEQSPFGFDAEYEYWIALTVAESEQLATSLGLQQPRQLVAAIVERGPEVVKRGEQTWLQDQLGPDAGDLTTLLREL